MASATSSVSYLRHLYLAKLKSRWVLIPKGLASTIYATRTAMKLTSWYSKAHATPALNLRRQVRSAKATSAASNACANYRVLASTAESSYMTASMYCRSVSLCWPSHSAHYGFVASNI